MSAQKKMTVAQKSLIARINHRAKERNLAKKVIDL